MYDIDSIQHFELGAAYADAAEESTNAPKIFHYATLLTVAGASLEDKLWFPYIKHLRPNLYTCLIGPSAISMKSTAMSLAVPLATVFVVNGISTMEGLVAQLARTPHVLITNEELSGLFQKAKKQKSSAALLPKLIELYDCPDAVSLITKKDPITVKRPIVSMLAASTPDLLELSMDMGDVYGGLANRFMFIAAPEHIAAQNPFPGLLDYEGVGEVLKERLGRWQKDTKLMWDVDARDLWKDYFDELQIELRQRSETGKVLAARVPEHTLKVAMIIHALSVSSRECVAYQDLLAAIEFMKYVRLSVDEMAPVFSPLEAKVLHLIEQGAIGRSKIHEKLGGRVKGVELAQALDSLIKFKRVIEVEGKFVTQ